MKTTLTQYFSKTLLSGVLGLTTYALLSGGSMLWAGTEPGYSHDGGVNVYQQNWMSKVPSNFKLSYLSLPGTHDTMSRMTDGPVAQTVALYGQTQSMDLQNQLDAGIRVLDIRIGFWSDTFLTCHGPIVQDGAFQDVLATVVKFLNNYPSETVLMRVKYEHNFGGNTRTFEQVFQQDYWNGPLSHYFWQGTNSNPTLAEIRGRIVVLDDFSTNGSHYGIAYNSFFTQDNYALRNNWDLYAKWIDVKHQLTLAHNIGLVYIGPRCEIEITDQVFCNYIYYPPTSHTMVTPWAKYDTDALEDLRFMNYLSGAAAAVGDTVYPYFVASGKSSPATDAPRLATGKTTPGWSDWPDFPRVDCLLGICTIAFEGTNNLTYNWLGDNNPKRVGIIMADFPGPGLIQRIIDVNSRLAQMGF